MLERALALSGRHAFFGQRRLVALQRGDAFFIRAHDRLRSCIDDAVEQRVDLLVELRHLAFMVFRHVGGLGDALVPGVLEHGAGQIDQTLPRRQPVEQCGELALDLLAADRFTVAQALAGEAHVIRMLRARAARRPAGRERLAAMRAGDRAAQREIRIDVRARRGVGVPLEPLLDAPERLHADQAVVPPLAQRDAPLGSLDISGVQHAGQDVGDELVAHIAVGVPGKRGMVFQESFHLGLELEAPACIAFERFLDDGGHRFIAGQHHAFPGSALMAISHRRAKRPVAVQHPAPHAVPCLLGVLLALVLRDRDHDAFQQAGIGVIAKLHRRAFQDPARRFQFIAQRPVRPVPACKPADVIDDDDAAFGPVLAQIGHQRGHDRAIGRAAGQRLAEHFDDLISLEARVLARAGFLRGKAMAFLLLSLAGDPAIQDGLGRPGFFLGVFHESVPPASCPSGRSAPVVSMMFANSSNATTREESASRVFV